MKRTAITAVSLFFAALSLPSLSLPAQDRALVPDATCVYAIKGMDTLRLDIFRPAGEAAWKGKARPAVLNVTGGGFAGGTRDNSFFAPWFKDLLEMGYPVVSIDYRLYMKGRRVAGKNLGKELQKAIDVAVEDLFSATAWLLKNGGEYGIDARNIVLAGGSAGAVTILQAEYELCNRSRMVSILPDDFDYAGIMSFAGAVFPDAGRPSFVRKPCPILLMHGTDDMVVPYGVYRKNGMNFYGSDPLARVLEDDGAACWTVRFDRLRHEVAGFMLVTADLQDAFMKSEVMGCRGSSSDTIVNWPDKPTGKNYYLPWLYDGKKH